MTLQQLSCFCRAARAGSFSAAARELRLSQPSVSEQVRRLEGELNARLLLSGGRGVTLTADGRLFLAHAERVLAGAEAAAAAVGAGRTSHTLSLGLTRSHLYYPFDEFVARAVAEQPDLKLRLPGQNSALVADAVRAGELQAGVVILPVDPEGLEIRSLFRDEVVFVSSNPERLRRAARIDDLANVPLILCDASAGFNDPTRRQLTARAEQARVTLVPRFDVEHPETAMQLAALGLGDTIAARAMTRSPSFPASLGSVPFAEPLYDDFALITQAGVVPRGLQSLLHALAEWADGLPDRLELERG